MQCDVGLPSWATVPNYQCILLFKYDDQTYLRVCLMLALLDRMLIGMNNGALVYISSMLLL